MEPTRVMTLGNLGMNVHRWSMGPAALGQVEAERGGPRVGEHYEDAVEHLYDYGIGISLVLSAAGAVASAIHGYQRNRQSLGWAAGWGALGLFFPVPVVAYALGQGFGKRA